jgi:tetratricopeptide (TPR) repeat protein
LNEPKSYQAIMLSSTFTDLKEHRQRATKAIEKFGYRANVMEYDGARADANVIESSLKMVRDSAGYICVISLKYGQTPFDPDENPGRLSITELEFNEAMRLGRPIVLFVMDDEHLIRKADIESDPGKLEKLNAFRERAKVMGDRSEVERVYEMFETLDQFSTAVAIAVGRLVQDLRQRETNERPLAPIAAGPLRALSNIPINVPRHFLGRDEDLAAIDAALKGNKGRVAITALHGLRGVGKTTLAAAYAEKHAAYYRATWWIRAETESTIRADLVGLGVRLGWVAPDEKETPALIAVMERLRREGEGILLIFDNAVDADSVELHFPNAGDAHVLVTSNAHAWRDVALPIQIEIWPDEIGAEYLVSRTGRGTERQAALDLSKTLGGLPLAHEQAAAYCERLDVSLATYRKRYDAAPIDILDDTRDAPRTYHNRLTVAKTFALAIDEAAKMHPAAEPLIVHAALLAPEPLPLFLFAENWERLSFQTTGFWRRLSRIFSRRALPIDRAYLELDEAVAALRVFALLDRDLILDEREPAISTECIRLHRLVRQVAATRRDNRTREDIRRGLVLAIAAACPVRVYNDPETWPRVRRLDALALALVGADVTIPEGTEYEASFLLDRLASYRQAALAAYSEARVLFDRALVICERAFGTKHPSVASILNNLARLLHDQKDLAGARQLAERSVAIMEETYGSDHPALATSLNNLAGLLHHQGNLVEARSLFERALAIDEKVYGPDHPEVATELNNLASLFQDQADDAGALSCFQRALAIREKTLGPDHPETGTSLHNMGVHLMLKHDITGANALHERALAIFEKALGPAHPLTLNSASFNAAALAALGRTDEAAVLRKKYSIGDQSTA